MKLIRKLYGSIECANLLDKTYHRISIAILFSGLSLGFGILYLGSMGLLYMLGMDASVCAICQDNGWVWAGIVIVAIPVSFYLGVAVLAGMLALSLVSAGRLNKLQAVELRLYLRFPDDWYQPSNKSSRLSSQL